MTAYSTACYFARQAASLRKYNGLTVPGLIDLARPRHGAIWEFNCARTGLVILLNAGGTVNAKATKEAREEAAKIAAATSPEVQEQAKGCTNCRGQGYVIDRHDAAACVACDAPQKAAKAEAEEDSVPDYRKARVVILKNGGCEIRNNDGAWIGPGLGHFRNVDSAIAWADAARPAPYVITNRDDALRLQAARDAALAKEQALSLIHI